MKNKSSSDMQNLHQLHHLDEELIRRRKEELRYVLIILLAYDGFESHVRRRKQNGNPEFKKFHSRRNEKKQVYYFL